MPKRRKLLLVNPVNAARIGLTVNRSSRFPPIGLGIVAALTPATWDVELVDENWERFAYREADLVGITAFTASVNRAYEIAAIYRGRGTPVVMGGIHASMRTEEALRFADAVVIGEAETVWGRVVADAEAARLQKVYQGEWPELAGLRPPRRDLFHPRYQFASVQTSRGCPMDCEFCSVTAFNGLRYRRRPVDDVLSELAFIPQKLIFFVDDNIVGYSRESREQAKELFRAMAERKLDKLWFCQASLNFADDEELLYWASRAGCRMVFIGLESEEVDGLAEVNKRLNLRRGVDSYEGAFQRMHHAGIAVLGAFIFGMDADSPEKLQRRSEYMVRSSIDVMQATILTPLPGTRSFHHLEQEDRLLYRDYPQDWAHFDMTEVVHRPAGIEPAILQETMRQCGQRIYSRRVLLRKALRTLRDTRSWSATMFAWNSNINYRNVRSPKS